MLADYCVRSCCGFPEHKAVRGDDGVGVKRWNFICPLIKSFTSHLDGRTRGAKLREKYCQRRRRFHPNYCHHSLCLMMTYNHMQSPYLSEALCIAELGLYL